MINEFKYEKSKKFGHLHLVYHFTIPLSHQRNFSILITTSEKSKKTFNIVNNDNKVKSIFIRTSAIGC